MFHQVLFIIFGLICVAGAVNLLMQRHPINSALSLVVVMASLALIYLLLGAEFVAAIQVIVYAGAIMVLFVFVIMILNRPEDDPIAPTGRAGTALGALAIVYLVGRLAMLLIHVHVPAAALSAPAALPIGGEQVAWGSVKAVGTDLFGAGVFPFEAISILLLVAVVGAIAIARPLREEGDAAESDAARSVGGAV